MQVCKVVSIEKEKFGKSGGEGYRVKFELFGKINKFVVFDKSPFYKDIENLKINSFYKLSFSKNDSGFLSLEEIGEEVVDDNDIQNIQQKSTSLPRFSENERRSIERQTALKAAVELVSASGIKFKTVDDAFQEAIKAAEGFYEFITDNEKSEEEI